MIPKLWDSSGQLAAFFCLNFFGIRITWLTRNFPSSFY